MKTKPYQKKLIIRVEIEAETTLFKGITKAEIRNRVANDILLNCQFIPASSKVKVTL